MDYFKAHVGNVRQKLTPDEEADPEAAMVSTKLKVPGPALPGDTEETNLHGDVPGSTYSRTPGERSWTEINAEEKAKADEQAKAPDREPEPRRSQASSSERTSKT